MFEEIKKDTEENMGKAIEALRQALNKIRVGRPNPSMLDQIEADYFDTKTPLKQLANISVTDATTITVNVWDKNALQSIEKAISTSDLGLSKNILSENKMIEQ